MKVVVVAGGSISSRKFYHRLIADHDLIIGADSGAETIRALDLVPNVVVGDFDSVSSDTLAWLKRESIDMREFPIEKDKTDMELAMEEAISLGATHLTLTATWGGRFDQTLANVFLLRLAHKRAISCYIREEAADLHLVSRTLELEGNPGDIVSVFALEKCTGVNLHGFKYQVPNGDLIAGSSLGVSNILLGKRGQIEVRSGLMLVIHQR